MLVKNRLWELLKQRGISLKDLVRQGGSGYHYGTIRRWLTTKPGKMPYSVILAFASVLKVPLHALDPTIDPHWDYFAYSELEKLRAFHDEVKRASRCLTITGGYESYLQPEGMLRWTYSGFLGKGGWDQNIDYHSAYIQQQIAAREESDYLHRVVVQARLIREARDQNKAWIEEIGDKVYRQRGRTAVGLVDGWATLCRSVSSLLPLRINTWDKITIVDGILALVRSGHDEYAITYKSPTVQGLLSVADQELGNLTSLPPHRQVKVASLKDANHSFLKQLSEGETRHHGRFL